MELMKDVFIDRAKAATAGVLLTLGAVPIFSHKKYASWPLLNIRITSNPLIVA